MATLTIEDQLMTPLFAIRPIVEAQGAHIITVEDDGGGAYMSLHDFGSTFDLDAYSNLALDVIAGESPDDISSYRWVFWVSQGKSFRVDSELAADADVESVLLFLENCLDELAQA